MAVLKVLTYPDKRLKTIAKPVEKVTEELRKKVLDMYDTMNARDGGGLAGTQVDYHYRVFTYGGPYGDKKECYINPEILEKHGEIISTEACLSFPGMTVKVKRAQRIKVRYEDLEGNKYEKVLSYDDYIDESGKLYQVDEEEKYNCRNFQHEVDHLNGIGFIDYFSKTKQKILLRKLKRGD